MSKWMRNNYAGNVETIYLEHRRFKTREGIMDVPDEFDSTMEKCKLYSIIEENKAAKKERKIKK